MRNTLTIITIAIIAFILPTDIFAQAEDIYGNPIVESTAITVAQEVEAVSYKVIIAFNNKKASKKFKKAQANLAIAVEASYDVQMIKAEGDMVTVAQYGNTVEAINIRRFIQAHGQGFLVLENGQAPQVIHDFDNLEKEDAFSIAMNY